MVEGERFDVEVVQNDRHTLRPIQLAVQKGVIDDDAKNDNYVIKPVDCSLISTTMLQFKWPWNVPLLGGGDLKGFSPDFNYLC